MRESIEDVKNKFIRYFYLLQPPLTALERVWDFIRRVFIDRYPRIRFWVADPQDRKYYGFRSCGMSREFEKKFDCKGYNPFKVKKYPVGFNEVPNDLKHPIEGDEESYILEYKTLDEWCKKGNFCPVYIQDIEYGIKIDEAVTIHIPHRLSRKTPLGAISLDFGRKGEKFNKNEVNILIALIGTFLRDVITPLIETELETAKDIVISHEYWVTEQIAPTVMPSFSQSITSYKPPVSKHGLVYNDEEENHKLNDIFNLIEKSAKVDSTVLIIGESGTGKELIARAIHYTSERKNKPFIPKNCSAFTESLLESELFGHEKGAFTGANTRKIGVFEHANGGTLFLDEIGDTSLKVQSNLLRVLQEKEIYRIGNPTPIKVDVRIIAATNRDLESDITSGRFRRDLFHRLNIIEIKVPPLRERKSDLLPLLRHFAKTKSEIVARRKKPVFIDAAALELIFAYDWQRNNVREVENFMEKSIVLLGDREILTKMDLPENIRNLQITSTYSDQSKILLYKPKEQLKGIDNEIYPSLLSKDFKALPQFLKEEVSDELKGSLSTFLKGRRLNKIYLEWVDLQHCKNKCAHERPNCKSELMNKLKCKYNTDVRSYKRFQQWFSEAGISVYENYNKVSSLEENIGLKKRCLELLKECYKEDQIKDIYNEGLYEDVFLRTYNKVISQYKYSPDKRCIAVREALETARTSKSGIKNALDK